MATPPMLMLSAISKSLSVTGIFSLSKSAISTALDIAEYALLLFGVILAVGIIGEYSKAENSKSRKRIFEILVIIGVAGEIFADGGIFLFSRNLQTISDHEVAVLNEKAEAARLKAGEANDRASKNEKEAAQLRKTAEEENLARVKIEERIAWRRLSDRQRDSMKAILRTFPPPPEGSIRVVDVIGSAESQVFADELSDVLNSTGWKVPSSMRASAQFDPIPKGVSVLIGEDAGVLGIASTIGKALTAAQVVWDGQIKKNQQVKAGMVHIRVGIKQ